MFSYFGSKTNVVHCYPKPKHDKIIEPFAGSARYSLRWFEKDVLLIDKYEVVVKIWKWLQQCSPQDILKLPRVKKTDNLNEINFDCEEAKLLMGFLIARGSATPRVTPSARATTERPKYLNTALNRIAKSLFKIKHWEIQQGCYTELKNETATWFIDPPYQNGGEAYKHGNKNIDFVELGEWCKSRNGQIIVCETTEADWLPFRSMKNNAGSRYETTEAIWSNEKTPFDNVQNLLQF